jgi:starch synthase
MTPNLKHVIMVASENDALVGGKVGGVGDVVRDLPRALVGLGWRVTVVTPSYGFLHQRNTSNLLTRVSFPFGGKRLEADVWEIGGREPSEGVQHYAIEHDLIRGDSIYFNDPPETPFMRDATKYAVFCSSVGQLLKSIDLPEVLHLHDWHAATYFLLRELHPAFTHCKGIRTAFTIHNLAIQGTRPMRGHESSVETWFPGIFRDRKESADWVDPRYATPCYTPMAAGIRYADKVNTVSPTYAEEILEPSDHSRGFYGGEGLEKILRAAKRENRLFGILNGCEYPNPRTPRRLSFAEICGLVQGEIVSVEKKRHDEYNDELLRKLTSMQTLQPALLLTAVARIVDQKVKILFEPDGTGTPAIGQLMKIVSSYDGVSIVLGSGTPEYERLMLDASRKHDRLLFVRGYFEAIANALYSSGTLFLMPSSFEPCGISQMVAMREGQPCLVHAVGGLRDTVRHGVDGFTFSGANPTAQVDGMLRTLEEAFHIFIQRPDEWRRISSAAQAARFTWEKSAKDYGELMYT